MTIAGDDSDGSGQNGDQNAAGEVRSGFLHLHQRQHVEVRSIYRSILSTRRDNWYFR